MSRGGSFDLVSFDRRLRDRVAQLLESHLSLPRLGVLRIQRHMTDAPVQVVLDFADTQGVRVQDHTEDFREIERELEVEFQSDPCFFGLGLLVPRELLDMNRIREAQVEQDRDNQRFRRIRLKDLNDG